MKSNSRLAAAIALALLPSALSAHKTNHDTGETFYEKTIVFPPGASAQEKIEMASRLVPSENQLEWQNLGMTAFLHFGINTFTDREWGDGKEDPALFNPTALDTRQWVRTLKEAGFRLVILTAKHHDGFCLWPTKTTTHSVAASPWREGKGDVVAELRKACDEYGMKLGLYLSPWDRNSPKYGDSQAYNDQFVAQLTELLSNYGKIDEVWFDGACGEGPNGKKQEYDWQRFRHVMETLQPEAVLAITGDDVRWVGNEGGKGRETEWSATPLMPKISADADEINQRLGINEMSKDLGSRELVARADQLNWWPSEVDVSIRPGWFYHDNERPHSLRRMAEIYLTSVGRNAVLLLNIPPDRRGLIHESDVARLQELRQWIDTNFSNNLITDADHKSGIYRFASSATVNCVSLSEDIAKGQRVEDFEIHAHTNDQWRKVAHGTTIGNRRIITFDPVTADRIMLIVNSSRGKAYISDMSAYHIEMPTEETEANSNLKETQADIRIDGMTLTASLSAPALMAGFVYTPTLKDNMAGTIFTYHTEISNDGSTWTDIPTSGEFSNIVNNPIPQKVIFETPIKARYIRLTAKSEIGGRSFITAEDFRPLIAEE